MAIWTYFRYPDPIAYLLLLMGPLMLLAVFDEHTVVDVSGVALPTLLQLQASLLRLAFLLLLSPSTLRRLYPSVTGILIAVDPCCCSHLCQYWCLRCVMRSLSDNLFHNDLFSAVKSRIIGSLKVEYGADELKLRCEYRIKASELSD